MSIANKVDCIYCISSPCKCTKEQLRKRAEYEQQYDLYWNESE